RRCATPGRGRRCSTPWGAKTTAAPPSSWAATTPGWGAGTAPTPPRRRSTPTTPASSASSRSGSSTPSSAAAARAWRPAGPAPTRPRPGCTCPARPCAPCPHPGAPARPGRARPPRPRPAAPAPVLPPRGGPPARRRLPRATRLRMRYLREIQELNQVGQWKLERHPLDVRDAVVDRYAREGPEAIKSVPGEVERLKWVGLYPQRQGGDAFMLRIKIPGGHLGAAQARVIGEVADEFARGPAPNPVFGDAYLDITTRQ